MRRSSFLLAAFVILASVLAWRLRRGGDADLPPRLRVETVVTHLATRVDAEGVVQQPADDPVRLGVLQPGEGLASGNVRTALVTPAPSRVRFRIRVPTGGALLFGVGVEGERKRDLTRSGLRFTVKVDAREVWSRTVNPARSRHHRRWFDERVDLRAWAGREVAVVLGTDLETPSKPAAGTAGWSRVRVTNAVTVERQPARSGTPSLLVVAIDTLRADRLGCYGAQPSRTPVLDAFASGGLVFEQSVAQSSWTLPSAATQLSGLHPRSHGVLVRSEEPTEADGNSIDDVDPGTAYLPDVLMTWAEAASAAGITTFGASANPLVSPDTNLAQGFETFVSFGFDDHRQYWHTGSELNDAFLSWLTRNRHLRFAAYLHYMEPHAPYSSADVPVPPGMRKPIIAGRPSMFARQVNARQGPPLPAEEVAHLLRLYDAEVRKWDRAFAALLDGLRRLGVRDSTVIVVTADHGEQFQEHGDLTHGTHLYEELVRVPLVIAGPGVRPGRVATQVQGIDLFPTIAAVLGVPVPHGLPGRNVLGDLDARAAFSETHDAVAPDGRHMPLLALRTPAWKLVYAPRLERYEFYDITRDPGEQHNRFATTPEAPALAAQLAAVAAGLPPPPPAEDADPALREKLRRLGYID